MSEVLVQALNDALKFHGVPPLFYAGMAYPEFSKASGVLLWAESNAAANSTHDRWKEILRSVGVEHEPPQHLKSWDGEAAHG